MAIDLRKLKALQMPTKEIEVDILGDKQKVTITAMGDDAYLNISDIKGSNPNSAERCIRRYMLTEFAGIKEEDADILLAMCNEAVVTIVMAIFDLSDEFAETRKAAKEAAEKKQNKPVTAVNA